jgi:hypothetical protein
MSLDTFDAVQINDRIKLDPSFFKPQLMNIGRQHVQKVSQQILEVENRKN